MRNLQELKKKAMKMEIVSSLDAEKPLAEHESTPSAGSSTSSHQMSSDSKLRILHKPMLNFHEKAYEHFKALILQLKIGFSVEDMLEVVDSAMVVLTSIFRQRRNDQINSLFSYGKIGAYYDRQPKKCHYTLLTYEDLLNIIIRYKVHWKFMPILSEESNEGYITRKIINILLDFHEDGIYAENIFRQAFKRISFLHPPLKCDIRALTIKDLQVNSNIMYLCFGELYSIFYRQSPPNLVYMSLGELSVFIGEGILDDMQCYNRVEMKVADIEKMVLERFMDEYKHETSIQTTHELLSTKDRTDFITELSTISLKCGESSSAITSSKLSSSLKINRHRQIVSEDEQEAMKANSSDTLVETPSAKRSNQNVLNHERLSICKTI